MRLWGILVLAVLAAVSWLATTPATACAGGYRVTQVWGVAGEGLGRLSLPKGVAVASDGSVWVVDYHNETLLKYAADGALLGSWGGLGRVPGTFDRCSRVAIGPDGTVYVTDAANRRIQRFSQSGRFLGQWGRPGTGPGEFDLPRGIDVARDGTVYVVDQANHRVQVFTSRGRYLRQWGEKGSGPGKFSLAKDIAVSSDGRVYVVDARTDRVQVFSAKGRLLGGFGGPGSARGRFTGPRGLCVDARGHVFVADAVNHRIQEFTGRGRFVQEWGCQGALPGQLEGPRDVAPAPDGSLVVVDTYNHRLERFVRDTSTDEDPPLTRCDQRPGWSAKPLEVALTATDAGSGVAVTYMSVDGGKFHAADAPLTLGRQGRHVVRYLSVDAAGNQEPVRRRQFVLDWTAPTVRVMSRAPLRAVTGDPTSLRFSVADVLSPECSVWIRIDRGGERVSLKRLGEVAASPRGRRLRAAVTAPRATGRYVLTITARDAAGNLGHRSAVLVVRGR